MTDRVCLVVVSHQQVGHGEQGRVHHASGQGEYNNTPSGEGLCNGVIFFILYFLLCSSQSQANHPARIDQLSPNIDWLGSELLDHLVQHEGVAGAREGVHGHAPAGKPHSLIVQLSTRTAFRILH